MKKKKKKKKEKQNRVCRREDNVVNPKLYFMKINEFSKKDLWEGLSEFNMPT